MWTDPEAMQDNSATEYNSIRCVCVWGGGDREEGQIVA